MNKVKKKKKTLRRAIIFLLNIKNKVSAQTKLINLYEKYKKILLHNGIIFLKCVKKSITCTFIKYN